MSRSAAFLRLFLLGALALTSQAISFSAAANAQTTTPASQVPSMPAPTPSTQGVPSLPAAVPATVPAQTATPTYKDPLETPIVVPQNGTPGAAATVTIEPPTKVSVASLPSEPAYAPLPEQIAKDHLGSTYIPVDSPVYPMALRLYSLGYLNTLFIDMRPWTRRSLLHALELSAPAIMEEGNEQAQETYAALMREIAAEAPGPKLGRGDLYGVETVYTRLMGVDGPILRDSYHLGQTINNDYGRPYERGFNNVTGFSSVNEYGRFSLYVRGEYQHAPAGGSYSLALAQQLSGIDQISFTGYNEPQDTIPYGNTGAQNPFRLQEASLSFHLLGHEISGGKSDAWFGPAAGSSMAWSNNAENIYAFRIDRVEPLHIPYLSAVLGPVRYEFLVGSLKGHSYPNDPWVHAEMFSFAPTANFQFGFERTVIWGGHGHGCETAAGVFYFCDEPINLHTFLKSFFSVNDTTNLEKYSTDDPGARFSVFNFSYRLPFLRHTVTLYTDSIAHDDVTPPSAPRRAAYRPGVFISHLPGAPRLDFRVEAASTDTSTKASSGGQFNYYETIQRQGYTNKGFIFGDWIGRQAKGGQAWLTYHLSGNEWVQLEYLNKKTPNGFIPGGTTQNEFKLEAVKRLRKDLELNAWLQVERWQAPIYVPGQQSDTIFAGQFTWYPKLHVIPGSQHSLGQ